MHVDSPSMEECLPEEMLEAILGKLDRETLCTGHLVSRSFCAAASARICSLTLARPSQAVSLERFPRLGHVRVTHRELAQLDPRLGAVITHLTVSVARDCGCYARMALPDLPGMPELRELDLADERGQINPWGSFRVEGAEVLHRLTNLEVLRISDCTPSVARVITTMTWLTSLVIGLVVGPGEWRADVSWLQHATNLRKLQALQIAVPHQALPLIGNLTGLTGLTWWGESVSVWGKEDAYNIAPLSRLSMLRSLDIVPEISERDLAIACSMASGSLAELRLRVSRHVPDGCGRLLAGQTALTRLRFEMELGILQHMGVLRMELLQSLELQPLGIVGAEGLDALQKATSLTELVIWGCGEQPDLVLSRSLGRLTQLRSLHVEMGGDSILNLPLALSPLAALTKLHLSNIYGVEGGDWRVLLSLTGLQVLELSRCYLKNGDLRVLLGMTGLRVLALSTCYNITNDVVQELGVLTNLRVLKADYCKVTSLAPATDVLNPLRQARGWPPVDACCKKHRRMSLRCG